MHLYNCVFMFQHILAHKNLLARTYSELMNIYLPTHTHTY